VVPAEPLAPAGVWIGAALAERCDHVGPPGRTRSFDSDAHEAIVPRVASWRTHLWPIRLRGNLHGGAGTGNRTDVPPVVRRRVDVQMNA
ncbi:MAG: hypothetical protein QOI69_1282, partial [Pseudonocardiales bacterium]|nr:hypothetical protein [Pseudonocardiales bacterium]